MIQGFLAAPPAEYEAAYKEYAAQGGRYERFYPLRMSNCKMLYLGPSAGFDGCNSIQKICLDSLA